MSGRNLVWPADTLMVTNLSNLLELIKLGIVCWIGDCRDRRRWLLCPLGYEKRSRNLLQDKKNYGILFVTLTRFLGD